MAALPTAAFKPVQEVLEGEGVVPGRYIKHKDEHTQEDGDVLLPMMDCTIIDLALLSSSSPQELAKLHSALNSWGCVQVVNHGMTSSFLDEVRGVIEQFFALPTNEKQKYFRKEESGSSDAPLEGYANDDVYQQKTLNWNDNMHLLLFPLAKCKFELWPQKPSNFRTILENYTTKSKMLFDSLLRAMARSLKLDENNFFELWGNDEEDTILGRFNFYPRCPASNRVDGLKPHGDGSAITIVLQDNKVEGLQILKDGKWFRVPIIPEAILLFIGDQMEIASNGIFKSPAHKVVVSPYNDRVSLAMFCIPNPEKEIGPLKELINEDRPQLYKRLKDYGKIFFQYYPENDADRLIHTVKINY
ncbi:probable 2-oxoglutarate-dependent dioxygenase ANS [Chenopodium quinoa]|uniref:Fe2OG dioxygenase domain-containing protein n=1 Tax=Chenopodium quinoa TaxID=63459 RepID=A0A803L2Z1_CHEQI|nr:probable 2-oxoglutarate-dependent dioxygenase ANS [Chenopodium quinoa]